MKILVKMMAIILLLVGMIVGISETYSYVLDDQRHAAWKWFPADYVIGRDVLPRGPLYEEMDDGVVADSCNATTLEEIDRPIVRRWYIVEHEFVMDSLTQGWEWAWIRHIDGRTSKVRKELDYWVIWGGGRSWKVDIIHTKALRRLKCGVSTRVRMETIEPWEELTLGFSMVSRWEIKQ